MNSSGARDLVERSPLLLSVWHLVKATVENFLADSMLSRGAAIAYYTVFALGPVLVVVIAVAGLVFDTAAAQDAVVQQLSGLIGPQSAELVKTMLQSAGNREAGSWATVLGVGTLLLTASGVFGELQTALNVAWKAEPRSGLSRLVRARLASIGLVATFGFLLIISLAVSAALSALDTWLNSIFPAAHAVLQIVAFLISFLLITVLFAAIYKVLPDKPIAWRDVAVGAVVTAFLFTVGKTLIGIYLGDSKIASGFGAAGALALVFIWVYYSAQIFLLGAEFTRVYTERKAGGRAESSRKTAAPAASHRAQRAEQATGTRQSHAGPLVQEDYQSMSREPRPHRRALAQNGASGWPERREPQALAWVAAVALVCLAAIGHYRRGHRQNRPHPSRR